MLVKVVTDKVEIARIKATMWHLQQMLPPEEREDAIRRLRLPRKKYKRIPKKPEASSRSASLISNTTTPRRKPHSKRRRCNYCPSKWAHTHRTEECRHWTMDGKNKHRIKFMKEWFARENEKIRACYVAAEIPHLYDPLINYTKQNCDTWDEIFACKRELDDHFYDGAKAPPVYHRITLPNDGQIRFYGCESECGKSIRYPSIFDYDYVAEEDVDV